MTDLGTGPFKDGTCFFKPVGKGPRFFNGSLVQLSMEVLHGSLFAALHMYAPRLENQEMPVQGPFQDSPYLKERMGQAGWCPSEYYTLHDQNSSWPEMYYLSSINRRTLGRDHNNCEYHFRCRIEDLDVATYETKRLKHCHDGGDCRFVTFEHTWSHRITRVVRKGQIPLIAVEGTAGQAQKLKVQVPLAENQQPVPSMEENIMDRILEKNHSFHGVIQVSERVTENLVPYVCISHVWSE